DRQTYSARKSYFRCLRNTNPLRHALASSATGPSSPAARRSAWLANSSRWEKCRVGRVIETHHELRAFWWVSMTRPTLRLKNQPAVANRDRIVWTEGPGQRANVPVPLLVLAFMRSRRVEEILNVAVFVRRLVSARHYS